MDCCQAQMYKNQANISLVRAKLIWDDFEGEQHNYSSFVKNITICLSGDNFWSNHLSYKSVAETWVRCSLFLCHKTGISYLPIHTNNSVKQRGKRSMSHFPFWHSPSRVTFSVSLSNGPYVSEIIHLLLYSARLLSCLHELKKKTTLNDSDGKSRQGLLISWYTMLGECWIFTTCKPLVNWRRNIMVGFLLVYDRELLTSCSWPWSSVWLSETRLHHTWLAMNENTISTVPPSSLKVFSIAELLKLQNRTERVSREWFPTIYRLKKHEGSLHFRSLTLKKQGKDCYFAYFFHSHVYFGEIVETEQSTRNPSCFLAE